MILNRAPLHNKDSIIGYFDYSACVYPAGQTEKAYLFLEGRDK